MLFEPAVLAAYEADDLVVRLVRMFAEDAPKLARKIVTAPDDDTRFRAAHALRGCALNLGAHVLAAACAAIETASRAGQPSAVSVDGIDALVAETIRALDAHCSVMQRAPL